MSKRRVIVFAMMCIAFAVPAAAQNETAGSETTNPIVDVLDELGGVPCEESDFTCVTLTVPLDHDAPDSEATLDVTFAVLPATGPSKGLFVTVMGGPGYAGLEWAADYSSYFDPVLFENFDVVFFDQRGIGSSNGLDCPDASALFSLTDAHPVVADEEQAYIDATRTFVESCVEEMEADDLLPYFGTVQAIHDLEAFRQSVGAPTMWLYGESYGTQFAQEYATAYPDALSGLILDGVVDLTLTGEEYYAEQTQAFNDTLTASLEACNADAACAADFGMDAVVFYDDLAAELLAASATLNYPLPSGRFESLPYTLGMLENSAYTAVYGRLERAVFVRALAAAARGDLLPLARLGYADLGLSPEPGPLDLRLAIEHGDGAAPYYVVECNDYHFYGDSTPDERAQAWLDDGDVHEASVPRLSIIYYTDLPCLFWPVEGRAERPEPFTGGDYTTFILNTSTDPATPVSNGFKVFSQLENAYMITQIGGPHVIFGREETCPDVTLTDWMVYGNLPPYNEFICPGGVMSEYEPLSEVLPDDAAAMIRAVDVEIQNLPEYRYWDVYTPLLIGCKWGGIMTVAATEDGERFAFAGCGFFAGFYIDGSGEWIYDVSFTLDVTTCCAHVGEISYYRDDAAGMYTITGTYDGDDISLTP